MENAVITTSSKVRVLRARLDDFRYRLISQESDPNRRTRESGEADYSGRSELVAFQKLLAPLQTKGVDGGPLWLSHFVFQGGGVLGFAHVGFFSGLERVGIRAAGVSGTSAGSIVALAIACARDRLDEPVSEVLANLLSEMPTDSFVDGSKHAKALVYSILRSRRLSLPSLAIAAISAGKRVIKHYGLNSGDSFLEWLAEILARDFNVRTVDDLKSKLEATAKELGDHGYARPVWHQLLKIISIALPLGLKFEFPEGLKYLSRRYWQRSPAFIARASMSIPLFFEPLELTLDRVTWHQRIQEVFGDILYESKDLDSLKDQGSAYFFDGGVLSNFPVDAFADGFEHSCTQRVIPTIGVALVSSNVPDVMGIEGTLSGLGKHAWSLVTAARQQRDREARHRLINAPALGGKGVVKIAFVDVRGHNWLNFLLDDYDKAELFEKGLEAAVRFIERLLEAKP